MDGIVSSTTLVECHSKMRLHNSLAAANAGLGENSAEIGAVVDQTETLHLPSFFDCVAAPKMKDKLAETIDRTEGLCVGCIETETSFVPVIGSSLVAMLSSVISCCSLAAERDSIAAGYLIANHAGKYSTF